MVFGLLDSTSGYSELVSNLKSRNVPGWILLESLRFALGFFGMEWAPILASLYWPRVGNPPVWVWSIVRCALLNDRISESTRPANQAL